MNQTEKNTSTPESRQPLPEEWSNTAQTSTHWVDQAVAEMIERIKANNAEEAEIADQKGRM